MNKSEIIEAIVKATGISKADAAKALDAMIKGITAALVKGDKVTITGFGTILTSKRAARKGRNPQTGKEIQIAASTAVRFKAGKTLKSAVN